MEVGGRGSDVDCATPLELVSGSTIEMAAERGDCGGRTDGEDSVEIA